MNEQSDEQDPLVLEMKRLRKQIINNQQQLLDIRKELIDDKKLESIISVAIFRTSISLMAIFFVIAVVLSALFRR